MLKSMVRRQSLLPCVILSIMALSSCKPFLANRTEDSKPQVTGITGDLIILKPTQPENMLDPAGSGTIDPRPSLTPKVSFETGKAVLDFGQGNDSFTFNIKLLGKQSMQTQANSHDLTINLDVLTDLAMLKAKLTLENGIFDVEIQKDQLLAVAEAFNYELNLEGLKSGSNLKLEGLALDENGKKIGSAVFSTTIEENIQVQSCNPEDEFFNCEYDPLDENAALSNSE